MDSAKELERRLGGLFRAIGSALIFAVASCTPDAQAPHGDTNGMTGSGPRLPAREVERILKKAKAGNVRAMHTLSVHHLTGSEVDKAYDWLREAARLGDCEAVDHLVDNIYGGVTPDEMPHWRNEQKRLACDPLKDYGTRPTIRRHPER